MGCNCKQKPEQKPIDDLIGYDLIRTGIIEGQPLSHKQKAILYTFYNEKFNDNVTTNCGNCWDVYIKDKLKELWIEKSTENLPS